MKTFDEIAVLTATVAMTNFDQFKDGKRIEVCEDLFYQPAEVLGRVVTSEYKKNIVIFASDRGVEFFHTNIFRVLCTKDDAEAKKWMKVSLAEFINELSKYLDKHPVSCGANIVSKCWRHLSKYRVGIIEASKEKGVITLFDAEHWLIFKVMSMGTFGGHATIDVEILLPDEEEIHDYMGYKIFEPDSDYEKPLSTWLNIQTDKDYSYAICDMMGWEY